jgi:hypothetical protein
MMLFYRRICLHLHDSFDSDIDSTAPIGGYSSPTKAITSALVAPQANPSPRSHGNLSPDSHVIGADANRQAQRPEQKITDILSALSILDAFFSKPLGQHITGRI